MNEFPFDLDDEDSLILLPCMIDDEKVTLALDTGATHTVIDLTKMHLMGYRLSDAIEKTQFATASGVIDAYIFRIRSIHALGCKKEMPLISSYDMFGSDLVSGFDGMLGLDFFQETDLFISFRRFILSLN